MKLGSVVCWLVAAACLASAVPPFPVTWPLVPTLDTPAQAYAGLLLSFKVLILSVIFAIYQQYLVYSSTEKSTAAGRRKKRSQRFANSTEQHAVPYPTLTPPQVALLLDNIVTTDRRGCVSQLICRLSALPAQQLTSTQKSIVEFLLFMPEYVITPAHSPRTRLMVAANVGRNSPTPFQSCAFISQSCPYDMYPLASLL